MLDRVKNTKYSAKNTKSLKNIVMRGYTLQIGKPFKNCLPRVFLRIFSAF